MLIVNFDGTLTIDNVPLYPGTRYIVSEDIAQTMINEGIKGGVNLIHHSGFNSYERRLRPEAAKAGDFVCVWRHNAFGDNLMVTGLVAYLKKKMGLKVHVACAPHVMPVYLAMDRQIKPHCLLTTPVTFDSCQHLYSGTRGWSVFYQAMLEENREQDQGCAIDDLWRYAGFDEEVGEEYRRPILRENGEPNGDAIGIALHSGNATRTLPFDWNINLIKALLDAYPKRSIQVYGLDRQLSERLEEERLPITNLVGKISFAETIKKIERDVGTMISPDSALLHLAEGLGIPNIGLWGLFHPDDRAKYYKHHTAVSNFDACEHSPCRWHGMNQFPMDKCGHLIYPNHCNALAKIKIEDVLNAMV